MKVLPSKLKIQKIQSASKKFENKIIIVYTNASGEKQSLFPDGKIRTDH